MAQNMPCLAEAIADKAGEQGSTVIELQRLSGALEGPRDDKFGSVVARLQRSREKVRSRQLSEMDRNFVNVPSLE